MTQSETPLDTSELRMYLSAELGVADIEVSMLHEALNYSLLISTPDGEADLVLRTPNMLRETESFVDLRTEYEVLQRLQQTPVDAPEPVLFCANKSVIGDTFLLMTHLAGDAVPLGTRLPERFRHPTARRQVATALIDTLADIHRTDTEQFTGLCETTTPREQVVTDIERFEAATSVTGHEPPALWDVADWLREAAPSDPELRLSHGDFRPGNVLFTGTDTPQVSGVLDWETPFLGDPRVELGYLLLRWRDEGDPTPPLDEIAARCSNEAVISDLRAANQHGLAPFTSAAGSPDRPELVDRYERQTGITVENERFYVALGGFMLAAVWADIHKNQVQAGESSNKRPWVEYMLMLVDSIVSGEFQLRGGDGHSLA